MTINQTTLNDAIDYLQRMGKAEFADTVRAAIVQVEELRQQVAEKEKSLNMLYGQRFSDRCYYALKSRAETAEAELSRLQDSKDTERLNWMEKHMAGASDSERYLPFRIYWGGGSSRDIRKVIDLAIAAKEGK